MHIVVIKNELVFCTEIREPYVNICVIISVSLFLIIFIIYFRNTRVGEAVNEQTLVIKHVIQFS